MIGRQRICKNIYYPIHHHSMPKILKVNIPLWRLRDKGGDEKRVVKKFSGLKKIEEPPVKGPNESLCYFPGLEMFLEASEG